MCVDCGGQDYWDKSVCVDCGGQDYWDAWEGPLGVLALEGPTDMFTHPVVDKLIEVPLLIYVHVNCDVNILIIMVLPSCSRIP